MDYSFKQCTATCTTAWAAQNPNVNEMLVDRLTNLPDELLIRIISLLPTKDAAAISVLSRRMRCVFPLITSLDFDVLPISLCLKHPYATERYPTFVSFVDTVLQAHQSRYITKFRLKVSSEDFIAVYFDGYTYIGCQLGCLPDLKSPRLNAWTSYPLTLCGLRELDLCILVSDPGDSQLPPAIFTCETLEVLKLEVNIGLDHVFTMPSYRLPNLKLLLLSASVISGDGFLSRLVSSCPVLEDLTFKPFMNRAKITAITSSSLRRLCLLPKFPADIGDNSDCVLISTPNLEYLEYYDIILPKCYKITIMQCLAKAVLVIKEFLQFDEIIGLNADNVEQILFNLFRPLSYVQHLSLLGCLTQVFDYVDERVLKDHLPVFPNLKHLELGVVGGATCSYYSSKLLLGLFPLLNCSPVLETLVFAKGLVDDYCASLCPSNREAQELEREFVSTDDEIPLCCRYHLKRIVIKQYYGVEREVGMILFLLRKALALEELVIFRNQVTHCPIPDQMTVLNSLNRLPRASTNCSIQVR